MTGLHCHDCTTDVQTAMSSARTHHPDACPCGGEHAEDAHDAEMALDEDADAYADRWED